MKYIAKPNLNNNIGIKEFDDMVEAVLYLEEKTGYRMSYAYNKKTKQKTYDWELVGKLIRKENE